MSRIYAVLTAVVVLASSACGHSSDATTPSGLSGNAVINGAVAGETGGSGNGTGPATATSIIVTVAGTSISASVNPSGRFVLRNVPSGTIELVFTGPGLNARITLTNIETTETIDLQITLTAGEVSVDADSRRGGSEAQLEGRVESLPPTTAANTFVAGGRVVRVTGETEFRQGDAARTFADLVIGGRVHVKGQWDGDVLVARRVEMQGTNTTAPVPVNGIVRNLSGTAAAFQFTVESRLVKGDATTEFKRGSFGDLANGVRVEVKGQQRDGFIFAREIHVNVH